MTALFRALCLCGSFCELLAVGCASTSVTREQRLNQGFARIQVLEAELERARAELERSASEPTQPQPGAPECRERCDWLDRAAVARERVCETARELADADALTRCEAASDALDACRAAVVPCQCR